MEIDIEKSKYAQKAMGLFKEGYNCAQAVFLAFIDQYHMEQQLALQLSSSFGGGLGAMREVCGAVSGMSMVAGAVYGYHSPKDYEGKKEHYKRIQQLAKEFQDRNHSIVCRELLGLSKEKDSSVPEKRTDEYYKKRPCVELVGMAAAILEEYIKNQNSEENQLLAKSASFD